MDITLVDKSNCTGCGACLGICPVNCITMQSDEEGFLYPNLENSICIQCELCGKICPAINTQIFHEPIAAFAMQRKKSEDTRKSSSGGAGAVMAEKILEKGGVAYGCVMTDSLDIKHKRAVTDKEILKFAGSKYVQSDFSGVYSTLREDCDSGEEVIVFGTPCEIAGVRAFLKKEYDNLILVDLICHGTPSSWLFKKYIEWLGEKNKDQIKTYNFRDKSVWGWGTSYKFETEKGSVTGLATDDPYYSAFIYGEIYRESCYKCIYAKKGRVGDITIGDYWGVERLHNELSLSRKDGISAILINTEKGRKFYQGILPQIESVKTEIENVVHGNSNLYRPAHRPKCRDVFYENIKEKGFSWANRHMYLQKRYYIARVKNLIPPVVKKEIKNFAKTIKSTTRIGSE